jgi:hypothetical protein
LIVSIQRDTGVGMLRGSILACLLLALPSAANARGADDPSTEDAPFAGNKTEAPAPFAASPSAGFGPIGQWVLSLRTTGDGGFLFFHNHSPGDWDLSLHPAIDYFITGNVSVGGVVGIGYSPADAGTTNLDIGGRAGFNLNANDHIGFWPTAGLSVHYASIMHISNTATELDVFVPILYHLVPHFFVGLGPSFSMLLSGGSGKVYGVDFLLGGWL